MAFPTIPIPAACPNVRRREILVVQPGTLTPALRPTALPVSRSALRLPPFTAIDLTGFTRIRNFYLIIVSTVLLLGYVLFLTHVKPLNAGDLREGFNKLGLGDNQLIYLYVPRKVKDRPRGARLLVSIHGYGGRKTDARGDRKVKKDAQVLTDLADEKGWVVLAPQFDEDRFDNNYQRLNLFGRRADVNLNRLIEEIGRLLPGIRTNKNFLFGFSGGGQFVHRYAAFNPDRIDRAVAGAAGWYMWPDEKLPYPIGINPKSLPRGVRPRLRNLCDLDLRIVVGEDDSTQSAFRRHYKGYDLLVLQGVDRRERAQNWVAALQKFAAANGWPCRVGFDIIHGTGHTRSHELLKFAKDFLSRK